MADAPPRVNRRLEHRYLVYRDCSIVFMGQTFAVTILNVSKSGVAFLGALTDISPGDCLEVSIEGVLPRLEAYVINVNYGRVGAKFDLSPDIAAAWESEFSALIDGVPPLE